MAGVELMSNTTFRAGRLKKLECLNYFSWQDCLGWIWLQGVVRLGFEWSQVSLIEPVEGFSIKFLACKPACLLELADSGTCWLVVGCHWLFACSLAHLVACLGARHVHPREVLVLLAKRTCLRVRSPKQAKGSGKQVVSLI